jgi:hypothetical protein
MKQCNIKAEISVSFLVFSLRPSKNNCCPLSHVRYLYAFAKLDTANNEYTHMELILIE